MSRLSLAQRFLIWSLVVLVVGMTGIGLWVSHQIEQSIIHRTASTTALYVDSLIAEPLQEPFGESTPKRTRRENAEMLAITTRRLPHWLPAASSGTSSACTR